MRPAWQALIVLCCAAPPPAAAGEEGAPETWAGHEILLGQVQLPLLGTVQTRTENRVLARVIRRGEVLQVEQISCSTSTDPVLGSSVSLPLEINRRLPPARFSFRPTGGWMVAAPWESGWGEEDVDGDGNPGATYDVTAPVCSGRIFAATHNVSTARGREAGGRLAGQLKVRASQRILGTTSSCLGIFASDRQEELHGTFAFVQVAPGSTCDSLPRWPVQADEPGSSRRR